MNNFASYWLRHSTGCIDEVIHTSEFAPEFLDAPLERESSIHEQRAHLLICTAIKGLRQHPGVKIEVCARCSPARAQRIQEILAGAPFFLATSWSSQRSGWTSLVPEGIDLVLVPRPVTFKTRIDL